MEDQHDTSYKKWFMGKIGTHRIAGCLLAALGAFMLQIGIFGVQEAFANPTSTSSPVVEVRQQDTSPDSSLGSTEKPTQTDQTAHEGQDVETNQTTKDEKQAPAETQDKNQSTDEVKNDKVDIAEKKEEAPALSSAVESENKTEVSAVSAENQSGFKTNLEDTHGDQNGNWEAREDGLYSDARGKGDSFFYSQSKGKNFVYSTDVTFLSKEGAAALVFRSNNDPDNKNSYAVNIDGGSNNVKFWRWQGGRDYQFINEKHIEPTADNTYHLKVVSIGSWTSYYVNDVLVASLGDYTLQRDDKGQNTYISEGYFGLLNWNSQVRFQNTFYKEITEEESPELKDITVTSKTGTVEQKGQFTSPVTIQYVKNNAASIDLNIQPKNSAAKIQVTDAAGHVYSDFKNIPLAVGANYLTVTSTITTDDGQDVSVTYRLNVHRRQADEVYYNELYRDQYHYSVKDGWANDPNGLVYYKGVYHFFYQFHDDTKWGPMHWGHATSTDLVHWKEQPIAFYPDANGAMFSGSIVADPNNTSGLFDNGEGGLVALITADGNGQRIKLAYSKDEGRTWTKVDQVAADWTDDPLQSQDFRDPKVFRWQNKWFMVVAGGPLRIYSSDNLRNWKVESTYPNLHTECPDLYPIKANDGTIKWVLSRGGRFYKVGDFKQVDGKWTFVPDAEFEQADQSMNFGKDSYAAMTYYVQDFGTTENPTLPELVEVNWMNTWDDYCNLVANTVGQKFNGTFNLNLKLGLVKQDGSYRLTQTPIDAYKSLRQEDKAVTLKDVDIDEKSDALKGFSGDQYEIVSTFRPGKDTKKVGFNLRVGGNEVTRVVYDLETETLSIDRSKSGIILSNKFAQVDSQSVKRNADGSIDLHIYVDRASVEVFSRGNTVAGANQIFPAPNSLGVSAFAEGGTAKADITLYPLASTWTDKKEATKPLELVQASPAQNNVYVGDTVELKAYVMPSTVPQDVVWSVDNSDLVSVKEEGNKLLVTALKKGTVKITATSKSDPTLSKEFTVSISRNDFKTNVKDLTSMAGKWYVDGESLYDKNVSANDYYMGKQKIPFPEYELDVDIKYQKGLINIFYASENVDPRNAYSVQFGDNDTVRLYRFMGDTIAEGSMNGKRLNDGKFHHVKVIKDKNSVKVLVDGVEYLNHTFDTVDSYYNDAYVGLGLWDGDLEVQNLFVTNPHASKVNKENLQKAVDKANDVDTSLYTEETVRAYQEALAQAKQILANENVEQSAVDTAAQNLNDAFGKLSAKLVYQVTPDEGVKELVFSKPAVNIITETIPFKRQERTNPNLKQGLRRLITAGKNGLRRILVEVSGDDRRVIEDSTVDSAIDEIVEVGTQTASQNDVNNQQTAPSYTETANKASATEQSSQTTTTDTSAKASDGTLPNTGVVDQVAVSAGLTLLGSGLVAGSRKKKRDKLD